MSDSLDPQVASVLWGLAGGVVVKMIDYALGRGRAQRDEIRSDLARVTTEAESLRARLHDLEDELEEKSTELRRLKPECEAKIDEADRRVRAAEAAQDSAQQWAEIWKTGAERMKAMLDEANAQIAYQSKETTSLRAQLADVRGSQTLAIANAQEAVARLAAANDEIQRLREIAPIIEAEKPP